jgi:5-methylcytosine-specific restriction endonuclease McrA
MAESTYTTKSSAPLFGFPPDKRMYAARRKKRLKAAREKGTHTSLQWEVLRALFNKCVRCNTDEYHLVKDHIKPLYCGGCDSIDNLQPLCPPCNAGKGGESFDYRPHSYPRWRDHFDEMMASLSERWP